MTTFAGPEPRSETGDLVRAVGARAGVGATGSSRREAFETLGLLLAVLVILLGLALTVGASIPIGR